MGIHQNRLRVGAINQACFKMGLGLMGILDLSQFQLRQRQEQQRGLASRERLSHLLGKIEGR